MGFGENMVGRYTWYQHIMQKSLCYHMLYSSKVMVHKGDSVQPLVPVNVSVSFCSYSTCDSQPEPEQDSEERDLCCPNTSSGRHVQILNTLIN